MRLVHGAWKFDIAADSTPRPAAATLRNLLIVHTPLAQDLSDWLEIKRRIENQAPDIEVRIAVNGEPNSVTRRWQVSRPSLLFSPYELHAYRPRGGAIYAGRSIDKLEQTRRLACQGLPVPLTAKLTRNMRLDPKRWGDYVVTKPLRGSQGQGVRLLLTSDVPAHYDELTTNDTQEMLIQRYVEHSEAGHPTEYRVLTLFGNVLYSSRNTWAIPRQALDRIASDPNGIIASNSKRFGRLRTVCNDAEIVTLAEKACAAFAECPVLGVDIVRDVDSGKLYVMETNAKGDVWHLSSALAKNTFTAEHTRDLYNQFGALDRAAELLIKKTRAEAA